MSADLTSLLTEHKLIGNHCWCGRTKRLSQHEHAEHVAAVIEDSRWLREQRAQALEDAADNIAAGRRQFCRTTDAEPDGLLARVYRDAERIVREGCEN